MVSIIFSDIDGTLLNDQHEVSSRTKTAVKECLSKGILFVPVSARMPEAIKPITCSFLPEIPIISYNGAFVQDKTGYPISSSPMPFDVALSICSTVEEQFNDIVWNIYSGAEWISQDRDNKWVKREEEIVSVTSIQMALETISHSLTIHKLLLMGEPGSIVKAERLFKENYSDLSIAQSYPYYLEIMASGITKGKAVTELATSYGVELGDTIAFGDNFNDLDMLQTVGKGYVMGNAPTDLKSLIGNVTTDNNHDGIAEVLERTILTL